MKTIKLFILIVLLISINNTLIISNCNAQFVQKSNGMNGGSINCLTATQGKIYAGTMYGGIYMTTNSGVSWVSINNDIQNYYVHSIAVKGNTIFAGCEQNSPKLKNCIFRSTNGGNNWESIQYGIVDWSSVYSIIYFGNYIFAGTNNGVYRAVDSTYINWNCLGLGNCSSLISNNNYIFAGSYTLGIYRSSDFGNTWEMVNNGLGNTVVTSFQPKGDKLFAGTNYGIYVTTNNGDNWADVNNGLSYTVINSFTSYDNFLFAGIYGGIILSTNDGLNWAKVINNMPGEHIFALCYDGQNLFAGAAFTYTGIYKSTNNGLQWQKSDNGIYAGEIWAMAVSDNDIFVTSYGQGVFMSSDFGENWQPRNNGLFTTTIRQMVMKGNNIFIGSVKSVFLSTDYGLSWQNKDDGLNIQHGVSALYSDGNNIYCGSVYNGFYITTNNGTNWVLRGLQSADIRAITKKGNKIFVATDTEGMYSSTDEGATWEEINDGLPEPTGLIGRALVNYHNNIFLGSYEANCGIGGIHKTTNDGLNWSINNNGINDRNISSFAVQDSVIFAGSWVDGLYISRNSGESWLSKGEGLLDKDIHALGIAGGYLFAGSRGFGVWRRPLSEIVSVNIISSKIPEKIELYQNYPNPFNPITKIRFEIPLSKGGQRGLLTKLNVYDILGREISTLVNDNLLPGTYETTFDAGNLPSGVYFYQLSSGDFTAVKKMMLIK